MTPAEFIAKWKDNKLSERAGAQPHFLDLCDLIGVEKPHDPERYCFERGAKRTGAGRGWADVWKRGCFAWEYKAPDGNLDAALKQLMTYALALDNPPLLIVSDRKRIEIHTHFTGTPSEVFTIAIDDIGTAENLQRLRDLFGNPEKFKPARTRTAITLQAAKLVGDLARDLQQRGHDPHQVAHFLNKLIFCFFAEDAKGPGSEPLLPNQLFSKVLETGQRDAGRFERQLKELFGAMANRNGTFGVEVIQWFNGGLFDDDLTLPLTQDDIQKLVNVSLLDWSAIEPSIFGTLFERGLDPDKRGQLGAHYTDPVSIMRIVDPVIVEPLLAEWGVEKAEIAKAMALFHELEASRKPADKARATKALKDATHRYIAFKEKLKNFKVLDPACGSGNFLYLALQSLKDIELRIGLEAEELGLERGFPEVGPQSMHGIEISPYAAELAKVTVWIGDIQWMLKHGFAPSKEPILKTLDQIECRDALLSKRAEGAWVAAEWPSVDVIIGNPPFLGASRMKSELGDMYTNRVRELFVDQLPGTVDLVAYWFAKATKMLSAGAVQRAGLVATNSIRQASNRQVMLQVAINSRIFEAWSDEAWVNEGASVRVSLVCFGESKQCRLNGRDVASINVDLTEGGADGVDVTQAKQLPENLECSFFGLALAGAFTIDYESFKKWIAMPNPHGRSNAEVLRPLWNGADLTGRWEDRWVVDFGAAMGEQEAALFEAPFLHVLTDVKPERLSNRRASRAQKWWRHGEARPGLRERLVGLKRYVATSEKSKHRVFKWLPASVAPDNRLIVFPKGDDQFFGIVSCRIHVVWAIATGSTLEDRPAYATKTCFCCFPFPIGLTPELSPDEYANRSAEEIADAAIRLNELRENWLNPPEWVDVVPEVVPGYPDRIIPKPEFAKAIKERTLTNLYNKREKGEVQWLEDAHRVLDAAVARAYGWDDYTPEMPDEEILRRLLTLNLERAANQSR